MFKPLLLLTLLHFASAKPDSQAFSLPDHIQQAVVGITENWNSSYVSLGFYERVNGAWSLKGDFWKGRIGKNGSAWGLGISPIPKNHSSMKKEGDGRSPAGVFNIGDAWGYPGSIKKLSQLTYHQITHKDLWVEDVNSRHYNRHIKLQHTPKTTWEKKQQMRQNDAAHALKLFVHHNSPEKGSILPGYGSAIFFHIWRANGAKPTSGCTTMTETRLKHMISLINPDKDPVFILLPRKEYMERRIKWQLP